MMNISETPIAGLLMIRPKVYADERGYFFEPFNAAAFARATGIDAPFVQDNESRSKAGVLRGLHLQAAPYAQAKLVRVVSGAVLDVCVDLRAGSATFGQHFSARLDAVDRDILYVPAGFAHGFVALENDTVFLYKCSSYYEPSAERTILWNDPELAIDWGVRNPLVSAKDKAGSPFSERCWEK